MARPTGRAQGKIEDKTIPEVEPRTSPSDEPDDAEIEIVITNSDAATPEAGENTRTKNANGTSTKNGEDAKSGKHLRPDDAFDGDNYAGYSGQISEASVSIVPKRSAPEPRIDHSKRDDKKEDIGNDIAIAAPPDAVQKAAMAGYTIDEDYQFQPATQRGGGQGKTLKLIKSLMRK